jgi:UDP-N-acetylglucosamine 2-epimerase (non-hydrolysing)
VLKILSVFGTRPEAIKMAPVIAELEKHKDTVCNRNCITGQHKEMIAPLLALFDIRVDFDLKVMKKNQTLEYITINILEQVSRILDQDTYDYLLVQGDTTTCMAASLAAFYAGVKIGHIEAGLRTYNKFHPYPEEANRKIIDAVGDLYFAHTENAKNNLLKEGVEESRIEVTGNTVIDSLKDVASREFTFSGTPLEKILLDSRKIILVTAHRRESFGEPFESICNGLRELATKYKNEVLLIYPVHLNPNVQEVAKRTLSGIDNILLIPPLDYMPFVHLMKQSHLVLTDSGGLQEEAPSLGKPVLVLRKTTERPEGVEAGTVKVIGTRAEDILREASLLLDDAGEYQAMATRVNPYGDGTAGKRIVKRILATA